MSLRQAADQLGVHYMTAYRYVRLGQLPSTQRNGLWSIRRADLEVFGQASASHGDPAQPSPASGRRRTGVVRDRLVGCLVAGDEASAWTVVERALAAGYSPTEVYLDLLAPALRGIGQGWQEGTLSVGDEHRASAIAIRIVGRLGPQFVRRGRNLGTIVVGAAPGDPHAVPVALLADIVRAYGFRVIDLGANVPTSSFADAAATGDRVVAVGVSISDIGRIAAAAEVIDALRERVSVPVLVGGPATDDGTARALGADGWAPDAVAAAELVLARRDGQH